MRNLIEYPVTKEEILESIEHMRDAAFSQKLYGDLRPLVLMMIEHFLEQRMEDFTQFIDEYNDEV